ncbi:hypothetical protein UFOVP917_20 [uncultured Caudovirales phage]|uniref:Uncharacterized protein n=1 Tax=uncultured Caudovirales phage TaxID=2100421 RepID=A0A6J5PIE4_9CAUD|nr:hypothetical protein UFOVP297_53 [uncultured Caudovirales phage]CAB4171233.1 hypothetical protein UFOVP917_20 [uncultured Caudovirales phage]CAB4182753.1 hypothetical protein UFOVP1094_22 [uncultured Caudovirales phage]CAB4200130.1 hypothetical protein UFOVP1342_22 [uncultured Caudovirales phage]CAB4213514.1 hypothetical protein UFOVP1450_36 [uncultured Caudovirales phage]
MSNVAKGIHTLCELMQSTDCSELVMEVGVNGGATDGARFLVHVIRQCPEEVEEEGEE